MAADFLGTFNASQFNRFSAFARAQLGDVVGRATHLTAELLRVGSIVFQYDSSGKPIGYAAFPANSYIGRLMSCYEILGGNALFDLNLRSSAQPVFLQTGTVTNPAQIYSNGEIAGSAGLADSNSALLMQQAKDMMSEVSKYKRDYLERKIRRLIDYADQLKAEIQLLETMASDQTVSGSMADVFNQINQLVTDPTYRPIYDDGGNDPLGKLTYAPLAGFEGGSGRPPNETYQRGEGGALVPGQGFIVTPATSTTGSPSTSANPSGTPTPGSSSA